MNSFIFKSLIISIIFCFVEKSSAQESELVISLKGNRYMQIQVCTDQIFRIRVDTRNEFPPTLMERYGILKTDWKDPENNF